MKLTQNHELHRLQYLGRYVSRIEKKALEKLRAAFEEE